MPICKVPTCTHCAYIDYPADISQGYGAVRSWLRLDRGRVADATADLKLADVQGNLPKTCLNWIWQKFVVG
jgi:hypothetical protein